MSIEKIENLPEYAYQYRFIVYRDADGQHWFWGAYSDSRKACEVTKTVDGYVFDRGEEYERSE